MYILLLVLLLYSLEAAGELRDLTVHPLGRGPVIPALETKMYNTVVPGGPAPKLAKVASGAEVRQGP